MEAKHSADRHCSFGDNEEEEEWEWEEGLLPGKVSARLFLCGKRKVARFKKCGTAIPFLSRGRGASKRQKKRERDGSRKNYLAIDQVLLRKKRGGGGALPPPLTCFFVPPSPVKKEKSYGLLRAREEGGGKKSVSENKRLKTTFESYARFRTFRKHSIQSECDYDSLVEILVSCFIF